MAIRKLNPTSAGTRFRAVASFSEITTSTPEKSLWSSQAAFCISPHRIVAMVCKQTIYH